MTIKYRLQRSTLSTLDGEYTAKVVSSGTVGIEQLAKTIAQTGITASESEIKSIISQTCLLIEQNLISGRRIKLGDIVNMGISIKGKFKSHNSGYNPSDHYIDVTASATKRLKKLIKSKGTIEKIKPAAVSPALIEYKDLASDTVNEQISINSIGQISGSNLDFDFNDPDQGLYFLDHDNPNADPIKVNAIAKATSKEIVFGTDQLGGLDNIRLMIQRRNSPSGKLLSGMSIKLVKN